jgi:hypothetical protein
MLDAFSLLLEQNFPPSLKKFYNRLSECANRLMTVKILLLFKTDTKFAANFQITNDKYNKTIIFNG